MTIEPVARTSGPRAQVLRATEVADMLRVPVSTVHEWARSGALPSRKRGKHRLFIYGEVEDWILAADDAGDTTAGCDTLQRCCPRR